MSDNLDKYHDTILPNQSINQWLFLLAVNLGYRNSGEMLADIREEKKPSVEIKNNVIEEHPDLSIPITKVYYIEKLPLDAKSMISGLPIDLESDIIVTCPNCGNMAERNLLEKWLKEKNIVQYVKNHLILQIVL
ncbi:MAG: hypothetical protein U9O98_10645 [Asgard group archaeon]|nr:hypothetical protein [Asgard group archaeon]